MNKESPEIRGSVYSMSDHINGHLDNVVRTDLERGAGRSIVKPVHIAPPAGLTPLASPSSSKPHSSFGVKKLEKAMRVCCGFLPVVTVNASHITTDITPLSATKPGFGLLAGR